MGDKRARDTKATDNRKIGRMDILFWITKAKNTQSE
jgi:hypothetical protein